MREQIKVGKEYYILSRIVTNATKCVISSVYDDYFEVTLKMGTTFKEEEAVELFAMTSKGQLYFETIVKKVDKDKLLIWFPISFKYLQRREYSRISLNEEIIIDNSPAQILDISAGGLKIKSKKQLELLNQYPIEIKLENNNIKCDYTPIRIEVFEDEFIISGRFENLSNSNKITLVQYCFGKQIEKSNK